MASIERVLLAHGDADCLARWREWIGDSTIRVWQATEVGQAVALAQEHHPQLLVVAERLRDGEGVEVCTTLQRSRGDTPDAMVLVAPSGDTRIRARGRAAGCRRVCADDLGREDLRAFLDTSWEEVDTVSLEAPANFTTQARDRLMRDLVSSDPPTPLSDQLNDPLTGLVTQEFFLHKLTEEVRRSQRYKQPLSLIVAQVKSMSKIQQQYGASAGDEALLELASIFLCESRDVDVAGRVADEVVLLMPATDRSGGETVAQRVGQSAKDRVLSFDGKEVPLQVLVGLATLPLRSTQHPQDLLQAARLQVREY